MFINIHGGLRLKKQKTLMDSGIEVMPAPKRVYIPFLQHQGNPAVPCVKPGDRVKIGAKIGEAAEDPSVCIHSSVSGKVTDIRMHPHPLLGEALSCIIESDYSENWENEFLDINYHSLMTQELIDRIRQAGIVGLGGGAFPTALKLASGAEKKLDILVINGCESEPNLTVDYHIMLEYPGCVIEGAKIIQKILGAKEMIFAISKTHKKAAALLRKEGVRVLTLPDKFPHGSERLLIMKITKRNVPSDKLPIDFGCLVQNVSTCYAVFQAVKYKKPLIERVISVSGNGINEPKNILVRIGTTVADIIEFCGGIKGKLRKVIFGGLMTGIAQFSLDTPVIKQVNGIVFQTDISEPVVNDCVRCAACIDACPMNLLPNIIYYNINKNRINRAFEYGLNDCIQCGCCAYVCPANIPLVHYFKFAKMSSRNG
ncbi:MAG: electron transport complex subunit RsxC [bacterium]